MAIDVCERWKELRGEPTFIRRHSLEFVKQNDDNIFYKCPFCKTQDHYAMVARKNGMVVHCYHSEKMSFLVDPDIISVIQEEENKFRKILDRFKGKLKDHYTPEEAFKLITSQGCPVELIEERTDRAELDRLIEEHKSLSRSKAKFRKEVF